MAYATVKDAGREVGKLRKWFNGGTWAVYHCRWCGSYHVGRQSARQRQAMHARRAAASE